VEKDDAEDDDIRDCRRGLNNHGGSRRRLGGSVPRICIVVRSDADWLRSPFEAAAGGSMTKATERVTDVADIEPRFRHGIFVSPKFTC
jgi:hypothetical protein